MSMSESTLLDDAALRSRLRGRLFYHWRTLSEDDAEDIVAITMFRYWRQQEKADRPIPWTWLVNVANHLVIDLWRRRQRQMATSIDFAASRSDGDDLSDRLSTRADIQAVLILLSLDERNVIQLRLIDGLSEEEAARALGVTQSSVKQRLHKARRRFRSLWETGCTPPPSSAPPT